MIDSNPYKRPDLEAVGTMEGLLYFIWEREAIRIARLNHCELPWTEDPILAKYKFTNIRRRDDRVSKWIIENMIDNNLKNEHLWFSLLIARLINWPPTLEQMIKSGAIPKHPSDFDANLFSNVIETMKEGGKKVYSGAYMIYPTGDSGGVKSKSIADKIIGDVVKRAPGISSTIWMEPPIIAEFVAELSTCFGISTFIAGQVAADLTYAEGHLNGAYDLYSYAPIGPGSSKGLNYLHNRTEYAGWTQEAFNNALRDIRTRICTDLWITDMTLHDVQSCMCEFSKYVRVFRGLGKPKSLYKPETEF